MFHVIYILVIVHKMFDTSVSPAGNRNLLIALSLVVVVLFLRVYGDDLGLKLRSPLAQEQEAFKPGSMLGHWGERSDGYANAATVVANDRHDVVEGMNTHEPPVFWNVGDLKAVDKAQQAAVAEPAAPQESLRARGGYVEGMSAGKLKGEDLVPY